MLCFPLHMFKTFIVGRGNDSAREEGILSGVAALNKMIFYYFGGGVFAHSCVHHANFSQQKETGLGLGKEDLAHVPQNCGEPSLLFVEIFNFFLRSKVLTLNCQLVYNTETV